jgi:class 3 adenylate cyclase/predicted ATPase
MQQIADWLEKLGMSEYAERFAENKIDVSVLRHLTDQDLKDIGVPLGHRRKMLAAIGESNSASAATAPAAPAAMPVEPARILTLVATPPPVSQPAEAAGERRYLTVMFCDLVGSTGISAKLDAEEWRDLVGGYLDAASAAVTEMGGHLAKKLGDGLMSLFGYPVAHENDAERAVRAALAIQRALAELNRKNAGTGKPVLSARIGVETGPAVVDAVGEIYGDVANIAARVQALAEPGAVLVTARVQRQVAGLFVAEERGSHTLKGVPEPTVLFRMVRASGGGRRLEQRNLTPLVGRDDETAILIRRWERARQGDGQLVLIVGEPGLGKSRLIEEFHLRLRDTPHTWVEWSCSQLLQNTPLHPIAEWGRQRFGGADVPAERRLADLENTLALIKLDPAENVPLLAPLLDIPLPQDLLPTLAPEELRRRQLAALTGWSMASARVQPVVLAFEDLHWADPTTLDVLRGIAERGALAPLFIVATTRPEFRPSWGMRSHHGTISLAPLDRLQVREMVADLSARHALPREVVEDVAARTGGVPLFVEEVTRLLLERGEGGGGIQDIPATLQQSLMARLDRLGPAREVAQIGSVIGRGFSYGLLRALAGMEDAALQAALERLAEADILLVEGLPPESDYRFKHSLIQDAAYENLLRSRRQALHRRVAELFESSFTDTVEGNPELVAHHYSEAGLPAQAATYWHRAGERAVQRSANLEAIGHLTTGLTQLAQLPETQERAKQELALQRLLGQASFATKGYASPEATRAFSRARELCAAIGDDVGTYPVLFGVWLFQLTGAYHTNAELTANEILERAGRADNTGALIAGNFAVGVSGVHLAKLAHARRRFEKAMESYRAVTEAEATRFAYDYGVELGAVSYAYASWCLWLLGYPDQALRLGDEALPIVERIGHDYSRSRGRYLISTLGAYRREWPIVEERAAAAIASAQEHGLAMVVAVGRIMQGAARAMLNPRDEAVAEIRDALAAYRATGARFQSTYHLILLAQALAACGRYGEGLSALREAASLVEETGERYVEAEINRLEGNLLLAENDSAKAEACYLKALEMSRAQEARSLELRAACDLARLWAGRGERPQAANLLAPVYDWFTEGFDTLDLKEAKALLEELHA